MAEYIEREALIAKLQAHKDLFVKAWGSFRKMPEKDKARADAITTCISDVMNATAADVVEVKRGKNLKPGSMFECSLCGWMDWDTVLADGPFNFCPNCGSDMREADHA